VSFVIFKIGNELTLSVQVITGRKYHDTMLVLILFFFVFPLVLTIMSDTSFHRHGSDIQVQEQDGDREHIEFT